MDVSISHDLREFQVGYVTELKLMGHALQSHKNFQAFFGEENDRLKSEVAKYDGSPFYRGKYQAFLHFQMNIVEKSGWDGWIRQYKQKKIVTQMRRDVWAVLAMCHRRDKTNVFNPFSNGSEKEQGDNQKISDGTECYPN